MYTYPQAPINIFMEIIENRLCTEDSACSVCMYHRANKIRQVNLYTYREDHYILRGGGIVHYKNTSYVHQMLNLEYGRKTVHRVLQGEPRCTYQHKWQENCVFSIPHKWLQQVWCCCWRRKCCSCYLAVRRCWSLCACGDKAYVLHPNAADIWLIPLMSASR